MSSRSDSIHWLQVPFDSPVAMMKFMEACKADGVIGERFAVRAERQGDMIPHRTKKYVVMERPYLLGREPQDEGVWLTLVKNDAVEET